MPTFPSSFILFLVGPKRWGDACGTRLYFQAMQHYQFLYLFSELILQENKLSSLPETLTLVEGLLHLNVSSNIMESVPEVIYSLPSLRSVNLSGNSIKGKQRKQNKIIQEECNTDQWR